MARRKIVERMFTVTLSDKELNYLDSALQDSIREKEFTIFKFGKDFGNIASLLRFTKRLQRKLKCVHYPPNGRIGMMQLPKVARDAIRKARKDPPARAGKI